jgi:hypothetical protein
MNSDSAALRVLVFRVGLIFEFGFGSDNKLQSRRVPWTLKINNFIGSQISQVRGKPLMVTWFAGYSSSAYGARTFLDDLNNFFFFS